MLCFALAQIPMSWPLVVETAAPVAGRADRSTYAGALAAGKPTEVAQQPFGLAVFGRYTFVADPANHVVRLLIDNSEVAFAGAGSLAVAGDGSHPPKAQLAGPYAVPIGQATPAGHHGTGFDVYLSDTFAHQPPQSTVPTPPIGNPLASHT